MEKIIKGTDDDELNEILNDEDSGSSSHRARKGYEAIAAPLESNGYYDDEDNILGKSCLDGYKQWTTSDGNIFLPASTTKKTLIPGVYEIKTSERIGIFFERIPIKGEGLIDFPDTASQKVVKEIQKFWTLENTFREFGMAYKRGILLWGPPGCHVKGTKILMHDGSPKNVEDMKIGDFLLGDDFEKREVLSLKRGKEEMYKITSIMGDDFIVNKSHILHLWKCKNEFVNMTVEEFLKLPKKEINNNYCLVQYRNSRIMKLLKSNPERFETQYFQIYDIVPVGINDYYGFELNKNHLYITEDGIIHHNSGKSCTIQIIVKDIIEKRNGIVFNFGNPELFKEGLRVFRKIQPATPIVILMEDIDAIIEKWDESSVLNILDGVEEIQRSVFLATTNHPGKLGARIVNRPSRFDKRFKIGFLNETCRKLYFEKTIPKNIIESMNINIDKWVEDTKQFSIAHLKELFIAVVIFGDNYSDAISTLKSMKEIIDSQGDGFGLGFGKR